MDERSLAAEIRRELENIKKELEEGLQANDMSILEEKARSSSQILDELSSFCGEVMGPDSKILMSANLYLKDTISLWKKKFWSIEIFGTSEGSLEINCSKVKFKKAMENLILNSMEAGASKVTINVKNDGIYFIDNGEGISSADSEKIKSEGTTKGSGRGHGLNFVREFLASLAWSLELVNNSDGKGLTAIMKKGSA